MPKNIEDACKTFYITDEVNELHVVNLFLYENLEKLINNDIDNPEDFILNAREVLDDKISKYDSIYWVTLVDYEEVDIFDIIDEAVMQMGYDTIVIEDLKDG